MLNKLADDKNKTKQKLFPTMNSPWWSEERAYSFKKQKPEKKKLKKVNWERKEKNDSKGEMLQQIMESWIWVRNTTHFNNQEKNASRSESWVKSRHASASCLQRPEIHNPETFCKAFFPSGDFWDRNLCTLCVLHVCLMVCAASDHSGTNCKRFRHTTYQVGLCVFKHISIPCASWFLCEVNVSEVLLPQHPMILTYPLDSRCTFAV